MNIENSQNFHSGAQSTQQTRFVSTKQSTTNDSSSKSKKLLFPATVAILILILLSVFVFFYLFDKKEEARREAIRQASIPQPTVALSAENEQLTVKTNNFLYINNQELWLVEPGINEADPVVKKLIDTQLKGSYSLSNSKTKVAYISNGDLKVKDLFTDEEIVLYKLLPDNYSELELEEYIRAVIAADIAWSSDDAQLAFVAANDLQADLYTIDIDGENLNRLTDDEINEFSPIWSPNDEKIAFQTTESFGTGAGHSSNIVVIDSDGNNYLELASDGELPNNHSFMPAINLEWIDNNKIFFIAFGPMLYDGVWQADINTRQLTALTDEVAFASHAWSEENQSLLLPLEEKDLLILDLNGENKSIETIGKVERALWSNDGSKIAFVVKRSLKRAGDQSVQAYDLFVADADGSNLSMVFSNTDHTINSVSFSSNNETIFYQGNKLKSLASGEAWVINIDGTNNQLIDSAKSLVGTVPNGNLAIYAKTSPSDENFYDYYLVNLETLAKEIIIENTEFIVSLNFLDQ